VTGRVLDVTTGPIVGATVGLRCTGVWCDYRRATTAQDGVFRFEGVALGPAELTCATGLLDRESLSMEISVPTVGTVTQDILTGVMSLQGVVRDSATGLPIRGVNVQLQGGASAQATTDVDGVYRFYDLRPSNPEVVFRKDGYGLRIKSSVSIPREGGAEYNVDLDPAAALHLLVLDAHDRPFTGQLSIGIKAQGRGTNVAMAINTDNEGRAWFRQIVPGEYDLTFRAVGVGTAKLFARVAPGENSLTVKLQ
jgi:hypothetical protein